MARQLLAGGIVLRDPQNRVRVRSMVCQLDGSTLRPVSAPLSGEQAPRVRENFTCQFCGFREIYRDHRSTLSAVSWLNPSAQIWRKGHFFSALT
jgi:hypothetical protein